MALIEHKGIKGRFNLDEEGYKGRVINVPNRLITFEGKDIDEMMDDFRTVVDYYLEE